MDRYDWPDEFFSGIYSLFEREEHEAAQTGVQGATITADSDLLDDVIQNNFDEERTWIPLGPSILRKGQATGDPLVSGRIRSIAVSPNGQRAYAGAANGGVWYTADAGQTWSPLGSGGLKATADRTDISLTIGDLCVVFGRTGSNDDPSKDIVYVGTGEARPSLQTIPGRRRGGVGVLRLNTPLPQALAAPRDNPWTREARNLAGRGIFRLAHAVASGDAPQADGSGVFYAATSAGLFTRSGPFAEDANWTVVQVGATDWDWPAYCSDVVVTSHGVWVTVVNRSAAEDGLYFSSTGASGSFNRINSINPKPSLRMSIAAVPDRPRRVYLLARSNPPAGGNDYAEVWMVDLAPATPKIRRIGNVPRSLFCSGAHWEGANLVCTGNDQGNYDQAIAVRRSGTTDIIAIGGSLKNKHGEWNASLFELTVSPGANVINANFNGTRQDNPQNDGTYIGSGIHADVHFLTYQGSKLWVGCDGGVFLHDAGTASSLNAGLPTLEPGYLAVHPVHDGGMIAGTQDNGVIRRVGDTLWEVMLKGDGGGCLYHPTMPTHTATQYTRAVWHFVPGSVFGSGPVHRWNVPGDAKDDENGNASFYSQAATTTSEGNRARLFIGTNRIWYTRSWENQIGGPDWVTIPTNTDPLPWPRGDTTQDILKFGSSNDAVIAIDMLRDGATPPPHAGQAILVLCENSIRIFRFRVFGTDTEPSWNTMADSISTTPSSCALCWPDSSTDIQSDTFFNAVRRPTNTEWTDIAVQDNTTEFEETFYMTTTGEATRQADGTFVPAPDYDTLWFFDGQGRWWPTGLATTPLDTGTNTGGSAAAAHSVVVHPNKTTVYVGNAVGIWEGELSFSTVAGVRTPSWVWKPAMEGLPQTVAQDLKIFRDGDRLYLRAALVSRGIWERDISTAPHSVGKTYIRSVLHDTGRTDLPEVSNDLHTDDVLTYDQSPDIALVRTGTAFWGNRSPNEGELTLAAARMQAQLSRANHDIFVMVHHRHTRPVDKGDVNIDLFLERDFRDVRLRDYEITAALRTFITGKVGGSNPTAPGSLIHIGRINPDFDVEARLPRAGKLRFNLNYENGGSQGLLIAVVTSSGNPFDADPLNEANLRDVVRKSRQIAVRRFGRG